MGKENYGTSMGCLILCLVFSWKEFLPAFVKFPSISTACEAYRKIMSGKNTQYDDLRRITMFAPMSKDIVSTGEGDKGMGGAE